MTNAEIIQRRMEYEGMKLVSGSIHDINPIMPFLLLDMQYQEFCSVVYPRRWEFRHEMNQCFKAWHDAYMSINDRFFRPFDEGEWEDLTDRMDALTDFVKNELMVIRVTIMNHCPQSVSFDDQKFLAACMLCNLLANCAKTIYNEVFIGGKFRIVENREMKVIMERSREMANRYYYAIGGRDYIGISGKKDVHDALLAMVKKMGKWTKISMTNESDNS